MDFVLLNDYFRSIFCTTVGVCRSPHLLPAVELAHDPISGVIDDKNLLLAALTDFFAFGIQNTLHLIRQNRYSLDQDLLIKKYA